MLGYLHIRLQSLPRAAVVHNADFVVHGVAAVVVGLAETESGIGIGAQQLLHL
jgi:hypothetical protein